jgi:hypothetical protein
MLFGSRNVSAPVHFPGNLSELSRRIDSVYSPEFLLRKTTLFPFYKPFTSTDNVENV